jgi:hypothetical protein
VYFSCEIFLASDRNLEKEPNQEVILLEFCILNAELKDSTVCIFRELVSILAIQVSVVTCGQVDQVNNGQGCVKGLSTRETGKHNSFESVSN